MATVIFYEKPGCATNARQKKLLEASGHTLAVRSLLTEPWTAARLMEFFGGLPVASWFNRAAPRVKSGAVDPERTGAQDAIALMLAEPLLIRRPLIETEGHKFCGFDAERLNALIGLAETPDKPMEDCSRPAPACPPAPQKTA